MSYHKRTQAIYMQVYYQIIEDIINKGYSKGDMLPTQNEFAEKFSVSRITIREAIKELTRRGIVEPIKGKGTFIVESPHILGGTERIDGLSQNNSSHFNKAVCSKVINIEVVPASEKIAEILNIPIYSLLTRIVRVRISDGSPACLDDVYLINKYVENIDFFNADLEKGSLYKLLKEKQNLVFEEIEERFRAVGCPKEIAFQLEINAGEPVLQTQRISYNKGGIAIEYCESYERSDLYYTVIRSKRKL